jgi:O-antigen/teichoic acid export membrane protein
MFATFTNITAPKATTTYTDRKTVRLKRASLTSVLLSVSAIACTVGLLIASTLYCGFLSKEENRTAVITKKIPNSARKPASIKL